MKIYPRIFIIFHIIMLNFCTQFDELNSHPTTIILYSNQKNAILLFFQKIITSLGIIKNIAENIHKIRFLRFITIEEILLA